MPTVSGSVTFALTFTDSTSSPSVSSVNTITLAESLAPSATKVAVLSGTVGTATVTISASTYKDSAGDALSITGIDRVFLSASGTNAVRIVPTNKADPQNLFLTSKSSEIAISSSTDSSCSSVSLSTDAGTNDYVVVIYGN